MYCRTQRYCKWVATIALLALGLQCFPMTALALEFNPSKIVTQVKDSLKSTLGKVISPTDKEKEEAQSIVRQRASAQNQEVRTTENKVNGLYNKYVTKNVDKLITPKTNSAVKFGLGGLEGLTKGTLDFGMFIYSLNKWTSVENINVATEKYQKNPAYYKNMAKNAPQIGVAVAGTLLQEGTQYLKKAKGDARKLGNITGYLGTIFAGGGLTGGAVKTTAKGLPQASKVAVSVSKAAGKAAPGKTITSKISNIIATGSIKGLDSNLGRAVNKLNRLFEDFKDFMKADNAVLYSRAMPIQEERKLHLINNKFPDDPYPKDGKIRPFKIEGGKITGLNGVKDLDFVIKGSADKVGELKLGRRHIYLAGKEDVLAAGRIKVSGKGDVIEINNWSGNYRPEPGEAEIFPEYFKKLGISLDKAQLNIYEFDIGKRSGLILDVKLVLSKRLK